MIKFVLLKLNGPRRAKTCFLHMRKQRRRSDAQLHCAADQNPYFRYMDSLIPLLSKSKFQASSYPLWLYIPLCMGPIRKPRRPVFSRRGSMVQSTTRPCPARDSIMLTCPCNVNPLHPTFIYIYSAKKFCTDGFFG